MWLNSRVIQLNISESIVSIQFRELAKLRWTAIAGQLFLMAVGNYALQLELSWWPLLCVLFLSALSNLALIYTPTTAMSRCVLLLDILLLTAALFFYGGYTNPFSMAYLVYITIAAFFLGKQWTWIAMLLSSLCFTSLFFSYQPVTAFSMHQHGTGSSTTIHGLQLHLQGMLVAFILIGSLIAYFITKMSSELDSYRRRIFSEDKLTAIASLTAGAAHELATPLGTVFLIAEELYEKRDSSAPIATSSGDLTELYQQLNRAKLVLSRMRAKSPELQGGVLRRVDSVKLLRDCIGSFSDTEQRRIQLVEPVLQKSIYTSGDALQESLHVLIKNALEASVAEQKIAVSVAEEKGEVVMAVRNSCERITDENFRRMGEPFFTTKEPGRGMGLGLYLVKTFAAQMSGKFELVRENNGLLAKLILPAS